MKAIVAKFGGTSMASATTIKQVAKIIKQDPLRKFIVVSAPGKRDDKDIKVTDLLYQVAKDIQQGKDPVAFKTIRERFVEITEELKLDLPIKSILQDILQKMKISKSLPYIVSRGEYLSALILSNYLDFAFLDAADVVRFKGNQLNRSKTRNDAGLLLKKHPYVVVGGFYGSDEHDQIQILPRGGSDISGALIADAVNAKLYENWTDVDGFLTCDPRIVEKPQRIESLTYRELRVLSFMGASVIQAETMFPLIKKGIPTQIKNTFNPTGEGTMIFSKLPPDRYQSTITGITGVKGFNLVVVEKEMMSETLGFDRKILRICEKLGINVEHFPSGTDTFSMMIESKYLQEGKKEALIAKLKKDLRPDVVEVTEGISLIYVVGRNLLQNKMNVLKVFSALVNGNVNLKMIDYGSNGLHLVIGVEDIDYKFAINALYNEFVLGGTTK
ncbi:MAG: aspartate kinase [Firmicutes bacterium]|nr:aspartate kinase [Bacillota bacterium]